MGYSLLDKGEIWPLIRLLVQLDDEALRVDEVGFQGCEEPRRLPVLGSGAEGEPVILFRSLELAQSAYGIV